MEHIDDITLNQYLDSTLDSFSTETISQHFAGCRECRGRRTCSFAHHLVIAMLVRLLIWGIVGFLVYTVFQVIKQALLKPPTTPPEKTSRGEEMVQDPECKTFVPRSDAVKASHKGANHYFCSNECRDKYLAKS